MKKAPAATPVAILVRVSTQKQETDRQVSELQDYASEQGYNVLEVAEETISGASDIEIRSGIQRVLELAQRGKVKKVLVHEVSRLARRNSVAHAFVEELEQYGVSLYWHSQRVETLLPNGKRNPASSIMFALLSEMARSERELLTELIKSGLDEAKRKGVKLGRPKGSGLQKDEFVHKHKDVVKLLKQGLSIRQSAKVAGKGVSTVQRVKAIVECSI